MHPNWEHWRDLKGTCPVCGKPSHVGASMRTGRYYWLHDDYDIREYYREHGKHSSLAEISFDVFQEMTRCAREHGIEPVATIGGAEAASKRVRCIETGKEYRSIQDAADDVQRSRASLSSAIKRSGTCAGCHWALISSSQAMGTRGGGTSGSWFPGKPETPQKRHGKGCGGTPFSMPFLLSH